MKEKYVFLLVSIFLISSNLALSQTLDATLLELEFSNDGYPERLTRVDNGFFFSSEDDQLWFSDGLSTNTFMVKDFASGLYDDITSLTPIGNKVFFVAENGSDNRELWVSEGTEESTIQLTDRNVSYSTQSIYQIIEYNGKAYFGAYSEIYGNELWVSDGTVEGTFVLKDIEESGDSFPNDFFVFNDQLIFKASVNQYGTELWTTDGTEEGTVLLKDIRSGNQSGAVAQGAIVFNGSFYFFANDGSNGTELWKSDGTPEGTELLKDIRSGNSSSSNSMLGVVLNDKLIFLANNGISGNELWETDGSTVGTTLFLDLNPGNLSGINYDAILQLEGDLIYFIGSDGAEQSGLWVSDGTNSGTIFLANSSPQLLAGSSTQDYVVYFAQNENNMTVLWKSDGTPNGTVILSEDVEVTNISVSEQGFLSYGNQIFFNGKNEVNGNELWVTDGTTEGTEIFFDVNHQYGVIPSLLTAVSDKLFFRGNKYGYYGLYTSDGNLEGTKHLNIGSNAGGIDDESEFIDFNGNLIVSADDGVHGYELWISDGTQEGTSMIKDINPGNASSMMNSDTFRSFVVANDKLYFHADDGSGLGMWVSDGTGDGTYKLSTPEVQVLIGHNGSTPFTIFGDGIYYFGFSNGVYGVYKIDTNTEENTFIHPFVQIEHMYVANNKLFIIQDNGETNYPHAARELWVTDGTTEGTSYLLDFADDRIDHVSIFNDEFYFIARIDDNANKALYKSDGTIEGTVPVFTNSNLPVTTYPTSKNLITCGNYLYFGVKRSSGSVISELYRTDGTESGTIAIVNEVNGAFNIISELSCFQDILFFKQYSGEFDFWITDSESSDAVGFNLNITNGPLQSIYSFTQAEDKLFFYGQTEESGSEIYVAYPSENTLSIENNLVLNEKDKLTALVYPNPANDELNIKVSNHNNLISAFEIYNLSGKKVIDKRYEEFKKEINLNVEMLPPGIYLIKININNKEQITSKFIVI